MGRIALIPSNANKQPASPPSLPSLDAVDGAMFRLLKLALRQERLTTTRDEEVAAVHKSHAGWINKVQGEITELEAQIEQYYVSHRQEIETADKKSVQLFYGLMGMRAPSNPGLVPLSDAWTWKKIEAKVRSAWKAKYFHKVKPPGLDKVKLKKDFDAAGLKLCGLALDGAETFYYELNRLAQPDQAPVTTSATVCARTQAAQALREAA